MTWYIGPVELDHQEEPRVVRLTLPQNLKTLTVYGSNPFTYSLGIGAETLTLEMWTDEDTSEQLFEVSRNVNLQPIRLVNDELYEGYYYVKNFNSEERGAVVTHRNIRIDLLKYGSTASCVPGFSLSDLESVSNDWGI